MSLREASDVAKARHWPSEPAVYARICATALTELSNGALCNPCDGGGTIVIANLVTTCPAYKGAGKGAELDVTRARWIEKLSTYTNASGFQRDDSSAYRKTRAPVYEWVFDPAAEAERTAAREVEATLMDSEWLAA